MITRTTRAVYYEKFGGTGNLQADNLPVPEVKEGEVLVKMKAAAVNPVDATVRQAIWLPFFRCGFRPSGAGTWPAWWKNGALRPAASGLGDEVYA